MAALSEDAEADWRLIDFDGRIQAEGRAMAGSTSRAPGGLGGGEDAGGAKGLEALFHQHMAREQLRLVRAALGRGQPLSVRGFRQGYWTRTVFRPVFERDAEGGCEGRSSERSGLVLCTSVVVHRSALGWVGGEPAGCEAIRQHDFGDLEVLSGREFEVLRLIGLSLSIEQIAKRLGRSPNTITVHRRALGSKLGITRFGGLGSFSLSRGLPAMSEEEVAGVLESLARGDGE